MDHKILLDDSHRGANPGVAPFTQGKGDRPASGDHARAGADYACDQPWLNCAGADHDTHRRLHARQLRQLPG